MMNIFFFSWTFAPSWSGDGSDGIAGSGSVDNTDPPKIPAGSGNRRSRR